MASQIQQGYLLLADISGFTSFMDKAEIDHGSKILRELMELIIKNLTPMLDLIEVEGNAVFVCAPESRISRGELLLELIESTYVAFRDLQRTIGRNATCPCKACQSVSMLDLKFVAHYGDYILEKVAGKIKPVGSCVNLIHLLVKNSVNDSTGWRGYALFSKKSLEKMGVRPAGMYDSVEAYNHLGEIPSSSINLNARYQELLEYRKVILSPDVAEVSVSHDFPAAPAVVWDWLSDPSKRNLWFRGASWVVKDRPRGRTAPAAQNHCMASDVLEHILDWRPFEYYTVRLSKGRFNMLITSLLETTEKGTRVRWNAKLENSWPAWIRRQLCRRLILQKWHLPENFETMEKLMVDAADPGHAIRV